MGNKTFIDAIRENTLDVILALLAQFDEVTYLPLLCTIEDMGISYYKKKYGSDITVDDIARVHAEVREMESDYELSEKEIENIESIKLTFKDQKKDKNKYTVYDEDFIPFS